MSGKDKSTYAIKSVGNALYILEAISKETGDFGVSHLSKKLGMSKSYVFRMLATFAQSGYVQHDDLSGRYRAGLTAYETGGRFMHQMGVLQKSKPVMEYLAKKTGEAVYLAIPEENDLLFLEMVDSEQKIRVMPLVGKRFSLDQFSAGKVILAHNASSDKLCNSLKSISAKGACVDYGAVGDGVGCLAVPIFNAQGSACASLCMLIPEFRLSTDRINKELLPLLKEAGVEVSAKLGHFKAELRQMCG